MVERRISGSLTPRYPFSSVCSFQTIDYRTEIPPVTQYLFFEQLKVENQLIVFADGLELYKGKGLRIWE